MSKLRLHKRYLDRLTIAVAFMLMIIVVTVTCSIASMQTYAQETTTESETKDEAETMAESGEIENETNTQSETGEAPTESESTSDTPTILTGTIRPGVKDLNVRTGPGTGYSIILRINGGLRIEILETVKINDYKVWYKISFFKGGVSYEGFVDGDYVVVDEEIKYSPDMNFDEYLEAQKFPDSYKTALKELHEKYPNWVFIANHVNMDWNTLISKENTVGISLIADSSISSWKSTETMVNEDGSYSSPYYNWDTSTWYPYDGKIWMQASKELLAYTLDPRNFLNETNIFMFERLSFDSNIHNEDGIKNIIAGTFMSNSTHDLTYNDKKFSYASAILYAAQVSKVSPYNLASRIRQEQGTAGTSGSISGNYGGYVGYYNYYNIGASSSADPVLTGLKFVSSGSTYLRPWNSRMKSIIGGAIYIGSNYISIGQDTIYYQKYDVIDYYGYIHQYMTHVLAPRSESVNAAKAYSDEMKKNTAIVFKIPVYNNMPEEICAIPTKSGSPNNTLASLNIEGYTATPSFGKFIQEYDLIVENSVSSINVVATPADNKAKVTGDGLNLLKVGNNKFDIVVTAENGDVRTYTINVVRKSSESGNLLYGDINSDNVVDITDCVMMKKHLAGIKVPINLETCDVNADNKIDVADAVKLMKKLAGMDIILGQPD